MKLSTEYIERCLNHLCREEKSTATQEEYLRDVQAFCVYADGNKISKELLIAWKKNLIESGYAIRSINSMLADILGHSSINTTRIYLITTGTEHRHKIDCLGLIV